MKLFQDVFFCHFISAISSYTFKKKKTDMDLALLDSWVFMLYESWSARVSVVPATYDCGVLHLATFFWLHFSHQKCYVICFRFFFFFSFSFSSQNTRCGILMMCFLTSFLVFTDSIEVGLCMFSIRIIRYTLFVK